MKFLIIGLGNFGSALSDKLSRLGHEVMGVDRNMEKVEAHKEKLTHAVALDCTEQTAVTNLPLRDTDVVIICIGEEEGNNIMATALMKKMGVKRLISRAVNPLHTTVLEAMGVDEIVHPEEETAERWAQKLNINGIIDSFEVAEGYNIVEAEAPKSFNGKTLQELALPKKYEIVVLTTIKSVSGKNELGAEKDEKKVHGVANSATEINEGDILVLYGHMKEIKKFLREEYE